MEGPEGLWTPCPREDLPEVPTDEVDVEAVKRDVYQRDEDVTYPRRFGVPGWGPEWSGSTVGSLG